MEFKMNDFENFSVVKKPHGVFLVEDKWPEKVKFSKEFFLNVDEIFVSYHIDPWWIIEFKLENAWAKYSLDENPFTDAFDTQSDFINGHLLEGKVLNAV